MKFNSKEEYQSWINSQDWYQTIELSNNIITPGKFATNKRIKYLNQIDFNKKRVIDIGCNSGQYCLYAKQHGASEVIGVDIDDKRLSQAKILAENENLEVTYKKNDLFDLPSLGQFDIVLCFAVLTEVQNIFGAIEILKEIIKDYCFLEMDLAKPLFYISLSKNWLKGKNDLPRNKSVLEFRNTKRGIMISPSLEVLSNAFGNDFQIRNKGQGLRYDMLDVYKARSHY